MENKVILLVEDNPRDEALTRRALAKNNIVNELMTVSKRWIFSPALALSQAATFPCCLNWFCWT